MKDSCSLSHHPVLDHPMTAHVFLAYVTLALSIHLRTEGEVSHGKETGRFSYSFVLHLPKHMAKNPISVKILSIKVQFFLF